MLPELRSSGGHLVLIFVREKVTWELIKLCDWL